MEEQSKQEQKRLQQIKKHRVATALMALLAVVIVLIILIILGYIFNWDWTGLSASNFTSTPQQTTRIIVYQPGKTLWDWLGLLGVLAVPVVVGFGVALFTAQQSQAEADRTAQQAKESELNRQKRHDTDIQIAEENRRDSQEEYALQIYIDRISELLLKNHLGERTIEMKFKPEYEQVRNLAQVRTITVLAQLNARRIGYVFTFLRAAGLMFSTPYEDAVSLHNADLHGANWSQADLRRFDLSGVNLSGANLSQARLDEARLDGADLRFADLSQARLDEADLSGANLEGAIITTEELEKQTKFLKDAIMPYGSIHP